MGMYQDNSALEDAWEAQFRVKYPGVLHWVRPNQWLKSNVTMLRSLSRGPWLGFRPLFPQHSIGGLHFTAACMCWVGQTFPGSNGYSTALWCYGFTATFSPARGWHSSSTLYISSRGSAWHVFPQQFLIPFSGNILLPVCSKQEGSQCRMLQDL